MLKKSAYAFLLLACIGSSTIFRQHNAKGEEEPLPSTNRRSEVNSNETDPALTKEKARYDKIAFAAVNQLAGKSCFVKKLSSKYQERCEPAPEDSELLFNGSRMYGKKTLTLEWFNRYEMVFEVVNEDGTKETGYYIQVSTDFNGELKPFATFYAIGKKQHWVLDDGEVRYEGKPYWTNVAPNECMGVYFILTAGGHPPRYESVYHKSRPGQTKFIPPDDTTSSAMAETIVRIHMYMTANRDYPKDLKALPVRKGYDNRTYDGWGRDLIYELDDGGVVSLKSLGRDGKPGGEGENADIIHCYRTRNADGSLNIDIENWASQSKISGDSK